MLSIVLKDDSKYVVFDSNIPVGTVTISGNPYHAKNVYLHIELEKYDITTACDLFQCLRKTLRKPLQVMLDSRDTLRASYLIAGGFIRMRRCYEMQVSAGDFRLPTSNHIPLNKAAQGSAEYRQCCEMQYLSYAKTHEAINPLTADLQRFCRGLPKTVVFLGESGQITHWAFIEENEIAYVGTGNPRELSVAAQRRAKRRYQLNKHYLIAD